MDTKPTGSNIAAGRLAALPYRRGYGCERGGCLDVRAAANARFHGRRSQLPLPLSAALAASWLAADRAVVAAPFGDQPLEVEHGPSAALGAVRRELVIVLVQGAEVSRVTIRAVQVSETKVGLLLFCERPCGNKLIRAEVEAMQRSPWTRSERDADIHSREPVVESRAMGEFRVRLTKSTGGPMKTSMITSVLCTSLLCGAPAFASCTRADLTGTWRIYTLFEGYFTRCSLVMGASGTNGGPTSNCYIPAFDESAPMLANLTLLSNCRIKGSIAINNLPYSVDAWVSTGKDSMSGMMFVPNSPTAGNLFSAVK